MTAFDHAKFRELVTQLSAFADGYEALNLDAASAAGWANQGFTPQEAEPWIAEGHTPERASYWCDRANSTHWIGGDLSPISPAEARERDNR